MINFRQSRAMYFKKFNINRKVSFNPETKNNPNTLLFIYEPKVKRLYPGEILGKVIKNMIYWMPLRTKIVV